MNIQLKLSKQGPDHENHNNFFVYKMVHLKNALPPETLFKYRLTAIFPHNYTVDIVFKTLVDESDVAASSQIP